MVSEAVAHLGLVDILVNNAGLPKVAPIVVLSVEEWRGVVGVNVDGPSGWMETVGGLRRTGYG